MELAERQAEEQAYQAQEKEEADERRKQELLQAEESTQEAIREGIEEHARLARDGWKLEAAAKVERASTLLQSHLVDEALALCRDALRQDPGNLHGYLVLAAAHQPESQLEVCRKF